VEFIRVTHSMPDCVALAIRTPHGTLVHTGDFKIDQTPPDGERLDVHRFAELGRDGVLAMFGDSTNIDRPGFTGSEYEVTDGFEEILSSCTGLVVVASFASSLHRMQILVQLAARFSRKVALVGHGMIENAQIAQELGRLRIPAGVQIRDTEVKHHAPGSVLCIATGSQGEPLAALSRIAVGEHRHVRLDSGDTVVFSARAIPGNEKAIGRVMNHVARRGADIVHEGLKRVHVSGHASAEELKMMLALIKPQHFVPIHGEYRQLARHARVAARVAGPDTTILLSENGDRLHFDADGGRLAGQAPAGRVLIDGSRTGEVVDEVLRDRRHLASDGLVVPVVAMNRQAGTLESEPQIITRGLAVDDRTDALLGDISAAITALIAEASTEERADYGFIKEKTRVELQRLFRRRTGRRPLVLPVVLEI
jgi:ribonuclease J